MKKGQNSSKKAKPRPPLKRQRTLISIRIDTDTIAYFKKEALSTGISYQNLMNMYLTDCAVRNKKMTVVWK